MRRSVIWTDPEEEEEESTAPKNEEVSTASRQQSGNSSDGASRSHEEVSADVDRLMDRITELRRLTIESLEVDVERAAAAPEDNTGLTSFVTDFRRGAVVPIHEESCRSTPRSSKTSKASASMQESAFAIARLEAVIQQVQRRGKKRQETHSEGSVVSMGSESGEELSVDDVLDDFRHRITNMEKEIRMWSGHLEEIEIRMRTDVLANLEQVIDAKLHTKCQALESKFQNQLETIQGYHKAATASSEVPTSMSSIARSAKQSLSSLQTSNFRVEQFDKDMPSTAELDQSLSSLQTSNFRVEQSIIDMPRTAELDQTLSSLQTSNFIVEQVIDDTPSIAELEQFADLKSQLRADLADKMAVLRQEVFSVEEKVKIYVCEQLRAETRARMGVQQDIMKEIEKEAKARVFDGINIRKMLVSSNSGLSNDISSAGSGRVSEHPESLIRNDVPARSTNGIVVEVESSTPNIENSTAKVMLDMHIANVARRCASLAESLTSSNVGEQENMHMLQLSDDLEKVATYLSGALQVQLESMAERIRCMNGKLETITKDLLPHAPVTASEVSTLASSPALNLSGVNRAPTMPSATRMLSAEEALKLLIPKSGSAGEAEEVELGSPQSLARDVCVYTPSSTARDLRLGTPSSTARELCLGTPQSAAREVCSGTPCSTARELSVGTPGSAAQFATPSSQIHTSPARGENLAGPSTTPQLPRPKSFAPSLRALGPGTPSMMHRNIDE